MIQFQKPRWWHPFFKMLGTLRPVIWLLSHTLHHVDRVVLQMTNGRYMTLTLLTGLPFLTLTTTGARSGQPRSVPLIGIPHNEQIILIASNWGRPKFPAWYHNLHANSTATVAVNGKTAVFTTHEATGAEYETCWQRAVSHYPSYNGYKKRAKRRIPVVVLTPKE
ncbi:MAG: nitroreductase family deazaflavin-dependent oxidoreductase [Chloroflexi bacterium]|nr:MAG: nitroreductase family deazaflavin-dependent oxidoreductase [Chloroflexota bacterium]